MLWGFDLGGTKIEGVILEDGPELKIIERQRLPTEAHLGYEHMIGQITRLYEQLVATSGMRPTRLGIGTPGTLDPLSQTMKNCNTTALNGMPLKRDLEAALGIDIAMANDANCFAVAEANLGAVKQQMPDAKVVFGVILGTGVGGGLVVEGKVINGRQGIGGEWGHNFLDESGGPCYCGRVGCVERIISGPALERHYQSLTGISLKLSEISKRSESEVAARLTIDRLIQYFGKAIAVIINIVDPDAIVLGGGVGNIDRLYTDGVEEAAKYIFNNRLDTVFLRPQLGDSAGVFGAALL